MHRLEAVADVGEGSSDDDGHGVVEIRPPHLVFDRDRQLAFRHQALLQAPARGPGRAARGLHVDGGFERVGLDEFAPRLHLVAHELGEDLVGGDRVVHRDPE